MKCNVAMHPGEEVRKRLKWKPVRCQLDPGHEGNHMAHTKQARFEWWNKEKNPQKE